MIRVPQKTTVRYIKYYVVKSGRSQYNIHITYFIDNGNPISNVNVKNTMEIVCHGSKELRAKETKIKKNIDKTQECLEKAFYRIGASYRNVFFLVNEKMR